MGITVRSAQAIGGPRGGTTWYDAGSSLLIAQAGTNGPVSFTSTTTLPGGLVAQIVTRPNPFETSSLQTALANQDILDSTQVIQALYGFQVTAAADMGAATTLNLYATVERLVGTSVFNGTSTQTTLTLALPLTQTIPNTAQLVVHQSAVSAVTITLTAAAQAGTTTLTFTSANLGSFVNTATTYVTWVVGQTSTSNTGPAFGWLTANTGTPFLPGGVSIVAPINTLNASISTNANSPFGTQGGAGILPWPGPTGQTVANCGFLPVQFGDVIFITTFTSSSTVSVAPLTIQLLLT